jgi:phenylacetaldehyde dehydrogenase
MTASQQVPSSPITGRETGQLLIDGDWVPSLSGRTFETTDPGTGESIAAVAEGDREDVDRAVAAARRSFEDGRWQDLSGPERSVVLWRVAELLEAEAEELAQLESIDQGLPLVHARGMVAGAARCFRYYAGLADHIYGATAQVVTAGIRYHAYGLREPIGVAALIIPWNAPLLMAAWKVAPALAAGCSCVLKPAEETPLTALRLGRILLAAGVPAGVVNIVTGFGETAGAALTAHPDVDKVAFTGSTEVGKLIVQAAAGNLKKLTLELGGKSPVIILPDADLAEAVPGAAAAIFSNSGQVCSAGSRLFVHEDVFDQVVAGVADIGRALRVGHGLDPRSQLGPLVSARQLERVTGYIADGIAAGSHVVTGGERLGDAGNFVAPTVLTQVTESMRVVREEIFGPVVVAMPFTSLDGVIAAANNTTYGLSASIWTRDVGRAHMLARKIRSGRVGINAHSPGDYSMPSGGYKESGWGREHGPDGLAPYLETKSVFTRIDG